MNRVLLNLTFLFLVILLTDAGVLPSPAKINPLLPSSNVPQADLRFGESSFNATQTRIIGGTDAGLYEFPWQVSLQLSSSAGTSFCGGSIISRNKIVTAAHCLYEEDIALIDVVAGVHNVFDPDGTEQRIGISNSVPHPDFSIETLDNDIAVLTLSNDLVYNQRVQPIQLAQAGFEPSGSCVNTGWGNTRNDGGVEFPDILQKVTLQIVDRNDCREDYGENAITAGMICAGDDRGNRGSCTGDSGGPLVCENSGGTYLAGVVSWGPRPYCALYPSVFANVAYFIDFINKN